MAVAAQPHADMDHPKPRLHSGTLERKGRAVRPRITVVLANHPTRGRLILLSTDTTLEALAIIRLYGWRFKTEVSFKPSTPSAPTPPIAG
jgi:hypothetical protein